MNTEEIIQILSLINTLAPGVASLILTLRHDNGASTTVDLLDASDAQAFANLKAIIEHQAKTATS